MYYIMLAESVLQCGLKTNFNCDYYVRISSAKTGTRFHIFIDGIHCVYYNDIVTITDYNNVYTFSYKNKDFVLGESQNFEQFLFTYQNQIDKLSTILPKAQDIKTYLKKYNTLIEETNYLSMLTFSLCALRTGVYKDIRIKISKLMFENKNDKNGKN